jgi:amino acid transporter
MGRWTLAALVVNAIVGSGIFGLPSVVARLLGRAASPWAWIVGAVGNGVIMLCFAEVASRFTRAGGAYLYARHALPRLLALEVGWFAYLTRLTAASAGANLFTVNVAEFLPQAEQEAWRLGILTLLVGTLAAVNLRGVRGGARLSNLFTVGKLVPLAILLAAGAAFVLVRRPDLPVAEAPAATAADWLRAILLVAFAYGGYDGAMMAMGEAREPRRDAPFALVAAMILLAGLYTGVQLVVNAVLADPGASERPLADAARIVFGPPGAGLLAAGALVSVAGFLGANFLGAPRLTFALAEHGDVPGILGRIHPRFRTPHVSILLFAFLVWALAVRGSFEWNATLSAVSRLFVYGSTCAALLVLRRRRPGAARLELPGGPILAGVGIAFCALLAVRMGRAELVVMAAVAAVATAHWLLTRRAAPPAAVE